ncbi:hypothetical protein ACH4S9_26120 [Streptomyces sp. NPDC021225]|uniref:hypothetical protein n=1 Tax=Streptomyces sp. NPDC021225 TaxID=3365121 RepID=UPI00379A8C4A
MQQGVDDDAGDICVTTSAHGVVVRRSTPASAAMPATPAPAGYGAVGLGTYTEYKTITPSGDM